MSVPRDKRDLCIQTAPSFNVKTIPRARATNKESIAGANHAAGAVLTPGFVLALGISLLLLAVVAAAVPTRTARFDQPDASASSLAIAFEPPSATNAIKPPSGRPPVANPTRDAQPGQSVDFIKEVRPIFARRCLSCHSGSEAASGLDLDDHANVLRGGDSDEPAVVPGDSKTSRLIRLITGQEKGLRMPPKGGPLDEEQIATLTRWVEQGAPWAESHENGEHWHWAYRSPKRSAIPTVKDPSWPRTPVDFFVLAKLEQESLKPSADADRATLIRRLSLDLVGLPPSVEEVEAFEQDASADAYEKLVDRLLASPHYGERWAQVWLDLARYADTHGYEKDQRRVMWPYRDWVIDAFNRDQPFDQFTIDQLAGDLLPHSSVDQLVATGFHRNTMVNEEGGVDQEEFRADAIIDRVNTTASVWLGSTVGCCQCHDHKFDPLTQKDYYRFFAFLNQDQPDVLQVGPSEARESGATQPVPLRENRAAFDRAMSNLKSAEETLRLESERARPAQEAWESGALAQTDDAWVVATPESVSSSDGTVLTVLEDGSVLAGGPNPDRATYLLEFARHAEFGKSSGTTDAIARIRPVPAFVPAIRLAVLPDPHTPSERVGRSENGNFVLSELVGEIVAADGTSRPIRFVQAAADFEQDQSFGHDAGWPVSAAIDGSLSGQGWAIGGQTQTPHEAVFRPEQPLKFEENEKLRLRLAQNYGSRHTIGRLSIAFPTQATTEVTLPVPEPVRAAIRVPTGARSPEQQARISDYFANASPLLRPFRDRVRTLRNEVESLTAASAMIMKSLPSGRETHVFQRGSFLAPGDLVEAGVPAVLERVAGAASTPDRLGLARWIVDPRNPLTARVQVNRLWARLFGKGLVETEDDFGTQGEPPTHPELLDWLATEFIRDGWSQKSLLRTIVTSSVYRQSSNVSPELLERDPKNRLLSRAPRYRVEAEMVRDIALAASGLLAPKIGGPSVFPPQPSGVWTMIYSDDKWEESVGEDRHRRGLYTFWRRTAPYPMFTGFDAPSREITCTRRSRTNTPLQALSTLNDPQFIEAAQALARRMREVGSGNPEARVVRGFRLCVGRKPSPAEVDRLVQLFHEQTSSFMQDRAAAEQLTRTTDAHAPELAAWQVVANVLLNLDETLTRN